MSLDVLVTKYLLNRFGSNSENEVSQQEVMEAETNWNIPIIKVSS